MSYRFVAIYTYFPTQNTTSLMLCRASHKIFNRENRRRSLATDADQNWYLISSIAISLISPSQELESIAHADIQSATSKQTGFFSHTHIKPPIELMVQIQQQQQL